MLPNSSLDSTSVLPLKASFNPGISAASTGLSLPQAILVADPNPSSFHVPAPPNLVSPSPTSNTVINVNYSGFTPAAQTAFQYAVDIWKNFVSSPVPIEINASFAPLGPGILGSAGPDNWFRYIPTGTWYPVALANSLAEADLDPDSPDIDAQFSSNFSNWYYGTDGNTPIGQYDFTSVVLHELGHGLGFLGLMDYNSGVGSWGYETGFPGIYDRFTENGAGQPLINTTIFPNPSTALGTQLTSNNIFFNGPNADAANGGSGVSLYAPEVWRPGSSYSHLGEVFNNTPNALMTYSLNSGESDHSPGPVMLGMFEDMGWSIGSPPPPTPTLAIAPLNAVQTEGNTGTKGFTFTVTRSGNASGSNNVNYAVTGSGANPANAADFGTVLPTGIVSFTAGQTSKVVTVNVKGDTIAEPDEDFTVTLSKATGGATIDTASAIGTILNDDTSLAIAADPSANQAEGNSGSTPFTFTVTRSGSIAGSSSANWAVTGGSPSPANAADFVGNALPKGTVTFGAGETSKQIAVNVNGDSVLEPNENFVVTLSAPVGTIIAKSTATGTIQNDDFINLAIAPKDAVKAEGNVGTTPFTFTVTRSGDTSGSTNVNYKVAGIGANPASTTDFSGTTGVVNFTAGQTTKDITVKVLGDTVLEQDEGFTVTLTNPTGGATITTATASGTIVNDDSSLSIAADASAVQPEGNSGATPFTFTVTRSGSIAGSSSANWAVTGGSPSPANAADFVGNVLPKGTVTFSTGETSKQIAVNVNGDSVLEPNENFVVTLSAPVGTIIAKSTATGTIQNDDFINLAIAPKDAVKAEGNVGTTPFTFTVTRSGDTSGSTNVNYKVAGIGANPASTTDFSGTTGIVSFAAGQTSKDITVKVLGDTVLEPDEDFAVTLSTPTGGATITTATATGTIVNDDSGLSIAADASAVQPEGNSGATPFTFTVTRSGSIAGSSSANWAVTGGSPNPANAADFVGNALPKGTVTFGVGETSKQIAVNVNGDTTLEPNENFIVTLSVPVGTTIAKSTATGTIQNDDFINLAIAPKDAVKAEGNVGTTPFTFTVTRSGDTSGSTNVNYKVAGIGANPASTTDFSGTTGVVNFTAGQTTKDITVKVLGDTVLEQDEGFTVTLTNPTGGATITTATATGTIVNDDSSLSIAADASAVQPEGNSGSTPFTFTVTRSGSIAGSSSANWAVTGGSPSPANAADFVGNALPKGTVTFGAGETSKQIAVNVNGDSVLEPNENFVVTLSTPSVGTTIAKSTATGTIQNDDVTISALEKNDLLTGLAGNASLTGFDSTTGFGAGEIDRMAGSADSDRFILGDSTRTYYFGGGDYARITDFSSGDLMQIHADNTLMFGQLSFSGNNILLPSNENLASLTGVNTSNLTAVDFTTVSI